MQSLVYRTNESSGEEKNMQVSVVMLNAKQGRNSANKIFADLLKEDSYDTRKPRKVSSLFTLK